MREFFDFLPLSNKEKAPRRPTNDPAYASPSLVIWQHSHSLIDVVGVGVVVAIRNRVIPGLDTMIPSDTNTPYDMRAVISRVVDSDHFFEVMPAYAPNIVIGFARLNGQTVGIVANQVRIPYCFTSA